MTPLVVAHRGHSAVAPENTLAAVAAALRVGADLVEIDVVLSADGVPVVLHDDTLDRTTSGTGPVAGLTAQRLRTLDAGSWFGPEFAGEPVPTLAEVVALVAGSPSAGLLVEFKGAWLPAEAVVAVDVLRAGGTAGRCLVQSFDRGTVAALREVAPDVRRALLVEGPVGGTRREVRTWAAEAVATLGVVACNPSVDDVLALPEVVAAHRDAGAGTFVWTVDDPGGWAALTRLGVEGIVTDDPAGLRAFLAARPGVGQEAASGRGSVRARVPSSATEARTTLP